MFRSFFYPLFQPPAKRPDPQSMISYLLPAPRLLQLSLDTQWSNFRVCLRPLMLNYL